MVNAMARATPEQLAALNEVFTRPMADDEDWRRHWRAITPLYFKHYDPSVGMLMDAHAVYSAAAWNYCNAVTLPAFNALPRLGEISVPTLIISGVDDWITPMQQGGERLHAGIPNSELAVFTQSGHWPFVEEKARFREVVDDWISRELPQML